MTREEAMIEALKRYPTEMMNEMFGPSKDVNDRDREKFIEGALWASSLPSPRWVKASERLPPVGIYCALYNGDHVVLQVHDGGFRIVFYNGELEDVPKISLIKWLDESGTSEVEELRAELKRVTDLLKQLAVHDMYDNCGEDEINKAWFTFCKNNNIKIESDGTE
jgi:hypothetical protein